MSGSIAGPFKSISVKNRLFPVAADASIQVKQGGYENEVLPNGDQTARMKKSAVPWKISGAALVINDDSEDLEFLQEIADGGDYVDITATTIAGVTWGGIGQITGEVAGSYDTATAQLTFEGPNKLTQQ